MSDKPSTKWPARDLNGKLVMVIDGSEYDALEAKLEAMERVRELLDEFQQEAQTRWKDYAPEQVNSWLIRIKTAAQQEKE